MKYYLKFIIISLFLLSGFAHPAEADITTGLVGWWKFDETSGTSAADSAGTNTGTLVGGPVWSAGKISNALNFDGVNDYVDITNYVPGLSSFTMSAWFQLTNGAYDIHPIFGNNQNTPMLGFETFSNKWYQLRQFSTGSETIFWTNGTNYSDSQWHQATLAVDQSAFTATLYIDSVSLGAKVIGIEGYTASNGTFLWLGRDYATFWKGKIDEARLYSRALSAADVLQLYNVGTDTAAPSAPTGLTAPVISSTQINLSWTASTDDVGVTGYKVERCTGSGCSSFAQIYTPAGITQNDTGLIASTIYGYRVRATDAAGNLSGYTSPTVYATTQDPSHGNITVEATLDGQPWTGTMHYALTGPENLNGTSVPSTFSDATADAVYALTYQSGGPDAFFNSITPASSQFLPGSNNILFTINFITPAVNAKTVSACVILVDLNGTVVDGATETGTQFTIPGRLPNGGTVTLTLSDSLFNLPIDFNRDIFGADGIEDAQCRRYVAQNGYYGYYQEIISPSANWNTSLYNDQYTLTVTSPSDFFVYAMDGAEKNSDGGMWVDDGAYNQRTLVVLSRLNYSVGIVNAIVKRVGVDENISSAPPDTIARIDDAANVDNPSNFGGISLGSHMAYASDVAGKNVVAGTCTYSLGGSECSVNNFNTACPGPQCALSNGFWGMDIKVKVAKVTKVVFKYVDSAFCGNGVIDQGENCDGSNLGGSSCVLLGFTGGTLGCTAGCFYDVSQCTSPPSSQCSDGIDNDGDGKVDDISINPDPAQADPGCSSAADDDEQNRCGDTIDNDADGLIDSADPGCHTDGNPSNSASYNPNGTYESNKIFQEF
ncbi:MAG: LamG-like jellyroll fold domain-containing protein [bacterium]|nr:LamG-like jellyroll fold domain-containing protein [bacterium]